MRELFFTIIGSVILSATILRWFFNHSLAENEYSNTKYDLAIKILMRVPILLIVLIAIGILLNAFLNNLIVKDLAILILNPFIVYFPINYVIGTIPKHRTRITYVRKALQISEENMNIITTYYVIALPLSVILLIYIYLR